MKTIVLDTNFMITALKFNINIFNELDRISEFKYKLGVVAGTITELEKLINRGKLFEKRFANIALSLIKTKNIKIIDREGYVDEALTTLNPKDYIIATQDKELKKKLKLKGFKILIIKQKKYLAIT